MSHWQIILTVLNITLGTGVIILLFNKRIEYRRDNCSIAAACHALFYNLLLWMALGDKYLRVNIPSYQGVIEHPFYSSAGDLLFFVFITAMALSILHIRKIFSNGSLRKYFSYIRNTVLIIAVLLLTAGLINIELKAVAVDFMIEAGCDLMFLLEAGILISLLATGLKSNSVNRSHKLLVLSFSILYLLRYVFMVLPIVFERERFLLSMLMLFYCNIAPLGWLLLSKPDYNRFSRLTAEYGISEREGDVLKLVISGKSNMEIAENLCISPHTAKNHIFNIYSKIGVNSRYQLMKLFSP